jgi:hypothetical protein
VLVLDPEPIQGTEIEQRDLSVLLAPCVSLCVTSEPPGLCHTCAPFVRDDPREPRLDRARWEIAGATHRVRMAHCGLLARGAELRSRAGTWSVPSEGRVSRRWSAAHTPTRVA